MKNVICEICGAEIKTNAPNFYTLFGQRACCEKCMVELSKKRAAETSTEISRGPTMEKHSAAAGRMKNQHGGHRPGSGRPIQSRGRLVRVLISLYPDQREWLAGQENKAAAVRAAIDEKIKREEGK